MAMLPVIEDVSMLGVIAPILKIFNHAVYDLLIVLAGMIHRTNNGFADARANSTSVYKAPRDHDGLASPSFQGFQTFLVMLVCPAATYPYDARSRL